MIVPAGVKISLAEKVKHSQDLNDSGGSIQVLLSMPTRTWFRGSKQSQDFFDTSGDVGLKRTQNSKAWLRKASESESQD